MERTFGKPNSPRHARKPVFEQLLNMAYELQRSSLREQERERFSAYAAPNLHSQGLKRLSDNILRFNNDTVPEIVLAPDPPDESSALAEMPTPDSPLIAIDDLLIDINIDMLPEVVDLSD